MATRPSWHVLPDCFGGELGGGAEGLGGGRADGAMGGGVIGTPTGTTVAVVFASLR